MEHFPQPPIDPPEITLCTWCDGGLIVTVAAISDCAGRTHVLEGNDQYKFEIDCPHCGKTGEEPLSDP